MAKDARMQKLIESRIKPVFDGFNNALKEASLAINDLSFELEQERRKKAEKVVSCALNKIKN